MLNYSEILPGERLKPFVRKLWTVDNTSSILAAVTKYVLPNTCFTLALVSGNGVVIYTKGHEQQLVAGNYVVGQLSQKTGVTILAGTRAMMVQFNPWAAALLSDISFYELTDIAVLLSDVNRPLALSLQSINMVEDPNALQRLQHTLQNYLSPTAASAFVQGCFQLFYKALPDQPFAISSLAAYTGYSTRAVEKKFKQHVGLKPKQTHTILKVRSVVDALLVPGQKQTLTQLAYRFNYADQSHLIKTYQHIMHGPPSGFTGDKYILPFTQ